MSGGPVSYDAEKAGAIIGRSADWMKRHARAGDIPHTRVGVSYRWKPEHLDEILSAGEKRPDKPLVPQSPRPRRQQQPERQVVLRARPPRRVRRPKESAL